MINIPAGPLSSTTAKRLEMILRQLEGLTKIRGTGVISVDKSNDIPVIVSHTPTRILILLTGHEPFGEYDVNYPDAPPGFNPDEYDYYEDNSECRYSWYEVDINPDTCGYIAVDGGKRGWVDKFPAVAVDGNDSLPDGTIVEAWVAPTGTHWRFVPGGAGGGELPTTTITFPICISVVDLDDLS